MIELELIKKVESKYGVKAIFSMICEGDFIINGIRLKQTRSGRFYLVFPGKLEDGVYREVAHPINTEFRYSLTRQAVKLYLEEE